MKIRSLLLYAALILSMRCSSPIIPTSSTETTNGSILGKLVDNQGHPEAGVEVHLFDIEHIPAFADSLMKNVGENRATDTVVFTNSSGDYAFLWPGPGTYNIIGESSKGLYIFIANIAIQDTTFKLSVNKLGTDTVSLPGGISGVCFMPDISDGDQSRAMIYLAGTNFLTTLENNGYFMFANVPQGIYTLVVHPSVSGYDEKALSVTVESGKIRYLDSIMIEKDTVFNVNRSPVVNGLKDTTVSINDTLTFRISATDSNGIINRYFWDFGDNSAKQFDTTDIGTCTHKFSSIPAICNVSVTVSDSLGKAGSQSIIVNVLRDPPIADAGPDTTVIVNSYYTIQGSGTDRFGTIVMYRFDTNEDGLFEDSSSVSGVKQFQAPSVMGTHVVILQVEDDDGNTANSMMLLDVTMKTQ